MSLVVAEFRRAIDQRARGVELLKQMDARIEPWRRQLGRQLAALRQLKPCGRFDPGVRVSYLFGLSIGELRDDDGSRAIEVGPERIVAVAEERAVRPGLIGRTSLRAESPGQADVARQGRRPLTRAPRVEVIDDRSHERPDFGRTGHRLQRHAVRRHPRHHVGTTMDRVLVRHRPHHRQSIGDGCDARQPFANLQAGDRRVDRLHFALNFGRRERLRIEGLVLRWRAEQEDEDTRLGSRQRAMGTDIRCCDEPPRAAESQPQRPDPANMQQVAPSHSITEPLYTAIDLKHGRFLVALFAVPARISPLKRGFEVTRNVSEGSISRKFHTAPRSCCGLFFQRAVMAISFVSACVGSGIPYSLVDSKISPGHRISRIGTPSVRIGIGRPWWSGNESDVSIPITS